MRCRARKRHAPALASYIISMGKGDGAARTVLPVTEAPEVETPAEERSNTLFAARVVKVRLEPHDNADTLSVATVLGWHCVVRTADFENTDRGVYIPLDALVPAAVLERYGLAGALAGPDHNRVKTIKLRGKMSQGLLLPVPADAYAIGDDLTEAWGITKYIPPVPEVMNGKATTWPVGLRKYDIERLENYPDLLQFGEMVVATEKLEGTNAAFDLRAGADDVWRFAACSRGIAFSPDEPENASNIYCQIARQFDIQAQLFAYLQRTDPSADRTRSLTLRGEIIGGRVQGNIYKLPALTFRAFDIEVNDQPLDYEQFLAVAAELGVPTAPEVFKGAFSEHWRDFSYGQSSIGATLREGSVWKPLAERQSPEIGRVQLKAVDPAYLAKKKD